MIQEIKKLSWESKKNQLEMSLQELPLVQYAWMDITDLVFSEKVRSICRECPRYGTSWSCPPGVGSVEECKKKCEAYQGAFVFTTIAEVQDVENMEETLATREAHEAITAEVQNVLRTEFTDTLTLSADSCAICEDCAYPKAACRFPKQMVPCIEGYGMVVPQIAEKAEIEFLNGGNTVTWFGMVLYCLKMEQMH